MHLAAVAAAVVAVQSGVVSPGDPVTVRVAGPAPKAQLRVYLVERSGRARPLATIPRGRRAVTVRLPRLPADYYVPATRRAARIVRGRGTLSVRALPPDGFGSPGAPGCSPPSPAVGRDVFGTAEGAELWALPFWSREDAVGKDVKTVFRLTSGVPSVFYAVSPDGRRIEPDWFEPHLGSSWNRPGSEWGAGFTFDVPGCWRIHAGTWPAQGDLWLVVRS